MYSNEPIKKETSIRVRLTAETKETFDNICKQKGYNGSAIIRNLLEEWINTEQNINVSSAYQAHMLNNKK